MRQCPTEPRLWPGRLMRATLTSSRCCLGQNALMWAAAEASPEIIRALVKAGADIEAKSKGGATALMLAGRHGKTENVSALLKAGAKVDDARPDGRDALFLAANYGHAA